MKPLILSFFAVILFYSLFLQDKKEKKSIVPSSEIIFFDETQQIQPIDSVLLIKESIAGARTHTSQVRPMRNMIFIH